MHRYLKVVEVVVLCAIVAAGLGAAGVVVADHGSSERTDTEAFASFGGDTAASPTGDYILAASPTDGGIVYNVSDRSDIQQVSSSVTGGLEAAWSGDTVAVSTTGGPVEVWDMADPESPQQVGTVAPGATDIRENLVFGPDGDTLYTTSPANNTMGGWDVSDPGDAEQKFETAIADTEEAPIDVHPDGDTVAVAASGGVHIHDVSGSGAPIEHPSQGGDSEYDEVAYSPSGEEILATSDNAVGDGEGLWVYDVEGDGSLSSEDAVVTGPSVLSAAWSEYGDHIVAMPSTDGGTGMATYARQTGGGFGLEESYGTAQPVNPIQRTAIEFFGVGNSVSVMYNGDGTDAQLEIRQGYLDVASGSNITIDGEPADDPTEAVHYERIGNVSYEVTVDGQTFEADPSNVTVDDGGSGFVESAGDGWAIQAGDTTESVTVTFEHTESTASDSVTVDVTPHATPTGMEVDGIEDRMLLDEVAAADVSVTTAEGETINPPSEAWVVDSENESVAEGYAAGLLSSTGTPGETAVTVGYNSTTEDFWINDTRDVRVMPNGTLHNQLPKTVRVGQPFNADPVIIHDWGDGTYTREIDPGGVLWGALGTDLVNLGGGEFEATAPGEYTVEGTYERTGETGTQYTAGDTGLVRASDTFSGVRFVVGDETPAAGENVSVAVEINQSGTWVEVSDSTGAVGGPVPYANTTDGADPTTYATDLQGVTVGENNTTIRFEEPGEYDLMALYEDGGIVYQSEGEEISVEADTRYADWEDLTMGERALVIFSDWTAIALLAATVIGALAGAAGGTVPAIGGFMVVLVAGWAIGFIPVVIVAGSFVVVVGMVFVRSMVG